MKDVSHLKSAEPLFAQCHQLLNNAVDRAKDGQDAVFQGRWEQLAKMIEAEWKNVQIIVKHNRRAR